MPNGRYAVIADDGTVAGHEHFRCAPGPMGWRYVGEIDQETEEVELVDLAVDRDWRIARLRIHTGGHDLVLEPRGSALVGHQDGQVVKFPYGPEHHLSYLSPATSAVTCRRLADTAEIDVLRFAGRTLEPAHARHRYERHGEEETDTPAGRFLATRWTFTDLGVGQAADLWLAGDTIVRYERRFTLEWYEAGVSGVAPVD
jgi:hypothetical protein